MTDKSMLKHLPADVTSKNTRTASKAEITFLEYFGVVSPKAGRTLVYKMSDVAKMYQHWNIAIPDFVKEICDGKVSSTYHGWKSVSIAIES